MPKVTLSSKNQITLPVEIVRKLGLKPGDKIVAELMDDHVVLLPQPQSWVDYFAGSMKGVYGSTVEEIDQYIREVRGYGIYDEWKREFEDILCQDEVAKWIVERLRKSGGQPMPELDFYKYDGDLRPGSPAIEGTLEKLVNHGGVRRLPALPGETKYKWVYRLVRDFAKP